MSLLFRIPFVILSLPFRWQALQLLLLAGISGWKPSTYFPNHHVKSLGRELKPTEKRLEVGLENWWRIQYEQNQWFQKLSSHLHFVCQLPWSRQWFLGKFPGQACTSWQSSLQIQLCCQHLLRIWCSDVWVLAMSFCAGQWSEWHGRTSYRFGSQFSAFWGTEAYLCNKNGCLSHTWGRCVQHNFGEHAANACQVRDRVDFFDCSIFSTTCAHVWLVCFCASGRLVVLAHWLDWNRFLHHTAIQVTLHI